MSAPAAPFPSFVRRLAGPVLLFFGVLLAVFALRSLGVRALQPGDARNLGALSIGIAAAIVLTRVIDYAIFDVGFRVRKRPAAPALLRQLVSIVVFLAVAAAVVKSILPDVRLGAVFTTSAILTAIVGLALQDTLGNLFAGLALHLERTMRVGDMIRYGETFGTVEQLSWREIRLRTTEGNLLLIPNSLAGRERLEVFARPGPPIARVLRVGLEYDASPEHARATLETALRGMKGIAQKPAPAGVPSDLRRLEHRLRAAVLARGLRRLPRDRLPGSGTGVVRASPRRAAARLQRHPAARLPGGAASDRAHGDCRFARRSRAWTSSPRCRKNSANRSRRARPNAATRRTRSSSAKGTAPPPCSSSPREGQASRSTAREGNRASSRSWNRAARSARSAS